MTGAVALSVPSRFELCNPRPATGYSVGLGREQRGCAVVASTAGPPEALLIPGPEGSSTDVPFAVPAS